MSEDFSLRAIETALRQVDPTHHDSQHVVEIVRDAARKLAYGFHLLNLTKLRLGGLSLFRLLLECLVGFPKFLGPLPNRDLKYFSTFGFAFGLTPSCSI